MPQSNADAALSERVQHYLKVEAEPWPDGDVDAIAELLERASRRGEDAAPVAAELNEAAAEASHAGHDAPGCDAAVRAGHHLARAATLMRRGWSQHERSVARDRALELYDQAMCSPSANTRAWAHLKTAHAYVDAGLPKDAWHHAQMAEFRPESPAMAAYYDQLRADLRDRIKRASGDASWLAAQLMDYAG